MRTEKQTFIGHDGGQLAARLDLPDGAPSAYALFAHCFTCTKDVFAASRIAAALTERGIAVLRFDFTGLGASDGEFANTNFSSNIQDLVKAVDHLRDTAQAPSILIGHSLGGAAVLAAAHQVPEAKAVATIGAPYDPAHVTHLLHGSIDEIEAKGAAEVLLVGRPFTIKKQFLDDLREQQATDGIGTLGKALLIFHAPRDTFVDIENAGKIYGAAKHPKSFISLDTADHLLTKRADAIYVADVLASWASRYVDGLGDASAAKAVTGEAGVVLVRETGTGKFENDVTIGRHAYKADEPVSFGGTDKGPGPYDYLLAGLGACTSMTLRLYAAHKSLPLNRVSVRLTHDKIHAQDCEECETKAGKLDKIERTITLEGDLTPEQRARLIQIADKCPVHRTLHSEVIIKTEEG